MAAAGSLAIPSLSAQVAVVGEICNTALMKDVLTHLSSDEQKFSYFAQVDSQTYSQLKSQVDASASVPIPLIGDMIDLIKASATYSQFAENRSAYFKRVGYWQDSDREIRDITVVTSPIAYVAWSNCIEAFTRNNQSVAAWKDQEDSTTVHVQIRNGTLTDMSLSTVDLINGKVQGQRPGKAFKDGTLVHAGGTLAILIRRSGQGVLKLAVLSRPQYSIPVIISQWGAVPQTSMSGVLRLTFEKSELQDRGDKRGDTWPTPDLHDVDCHQQPCMGRYQGATGVLWLTADANLQLRNPRLKCDVDNQGACGWANDEATARCEVAQGGTRASCAVTTGSRSHRDVIVANQFEVVSRPSPAPAQPILLFGGSQFELIVPTNALSAIFEYRIAHNTGSLKPGDAASPEGALALVGHADAGDATHYMYRVLTPPKTVGYTSP